MKVFRVLSTAFVRILLFTTFHTSALSSGHVFTVLLTYIPPVMTVLTWKWPGRLDVLAPPLAYGCL